LQGSEVICSLGTLSGGQSVPVGFVFDALEVGTVNPTVSVAGNETDVNPANNSQTFPVEVTAIADLVLSPLTASHSVNISAEAQVELAVENVGPSAANNVLLTLSLPEEATVGDIDSRCQAGSSLVCNLGTMETEATDSVQIRLSFGAEGVFSSAVTLSADEFDPTQEDNSGEIEFAVTEVALLVFPHAIHAENAFPSNRYIGVAVFNPNNNPTDVEFIAYDAMGQELGRTMLSELEGWSEIPPKGQSALLTSEILPLEGVTTIVAQGDRGRTQLFFMLGDFDLTSLDGVAGPLTEGRRLYFPMARANANEATVLFLFNASFEEEVEATLQLYDSGGSLLAEKVETVVAQGSITGPLTEIFGLETIDGYMKVVASGELKGFTVFSQGNGISALQALPGRKVKRLIAPHYFATHGGNTELRLQNVGLNYADVVIRGFADDGTLVGETSMRLQKGERFVGLVTEFLPIEINGADVATGYLVVDMAGGPVGIFPTDPTVLGAITFTAFDGETVATLPLVEEGRRDSRFLHVAQSINGFNMYTGLAILNAGEKVANVTVKVSDKNGELAGEATIGPMEPGTRVVDVLDGATFFQADFQLVGGHIEVVSDEPVVIFALFGDYDGKFLAAIEGQSP
jgi:hypothetical protein